jgi:hypothetical protein
MLARREPQVLRPYNRAEAIPVAEAVLIAGCSVRTMREWCARYDIGRRIGGQWAVSRVALAMLLDGNKEALVAYLAGDRSSPRVTEYFERCGVPLPKQIRVPDSFRESMLSEPKGSRQWMSEFVPSIRK